ncbi:MAG: transcriptional regulator, LysR family [Myxococcaceae bacterium]|nr:transcriptional regulator, LysR family [Myxococcaceae bacterium]
MNQEQLQAFLAVATHGTFSSAALQLHKSQPAVSKLVKNLEQELGLALLDRTPYRPVLTDAGKLFAERARELCQQTESLRSFARSLAGEVEPVLRVVREAVTPLRRIMDVLRKLQRCYPTVRIELRTERMAGALEALHDQTAHLVLTSAQGMDKRTIEAQPFERVRILPVARYDHPLAQAGAPVPEQLLKQHAQVLLRDSARNDPRHHLNVLEGGLHWSVTDLISKLEIIQAGMGWGGLPEHIVARHIAAGTLVELQVRQFDVDVIDLFTMRRRDQAPGVVAQALWAGLTRDKGVTKPARKAPTRRRK